MFSAVLLEFENVVAVTGAARRDALRESLAEDGVTIGDAAYDDRCAGLAPHEAVVAAARAAGAALDDTALELATRRAERAFAERVGKGVLLAPGAREFIEHAHGRAPLALVTRASRREVEFVLSLAGLAPAFECVVAAEDVRRPRPDPAAHALALAKLARRRPVSPTAAVALEDAEPGVRAAHAAGLRCVAVGGLPAYQAATADAYVESLAGQTLDSVFRLVTHGQERVTHD